MMNAYSKVKKAIQEGGVELLFKRMAWKLQTAFAQDSLLSSFAHSMPHGLPLMPIEIKDMHITDEDVLIAERILKSFNKAVRDEKKYKNPGDEDLWDIITKNQHGDFFEAFSSNDPRKVADYLCNMHRRSIAHGISDFNEVHYGRASAKIRRQNIALIKDKMVCLGEAIGVLPYKMTGENIYVDSDILVGDIERRLGITITPPDIDGGLVKVKMGQGYFSLRDIYSIYIAWRMSQLVESEGSSLCEIGAGLGKTALYAHRFGFLDYSIFDLPQINVVQAWYLLKSGMDVVLYGEIEKTENSIKILPYWEFGGEKEYTLTLNADSFPEIRKDIVAGYLGKIKKNTKEYFLSINHEHQSRYGDTRHLIVSNLIEELGVYRRVYRFPFWLREGYVEELYKTRSM